MTLSDTNAGATGADKLVETLKQAGVDTYFANPGTSEMQLVSAIDKTDGVRSVLALFEGVATGAADGYARVLNKPAGVLLHLGPGLGNGWANLHNARRAYAPVLNIVGDHAVDHLALDAPLTSDLDGISGSISHSSIRPDGKHDLSGAGLRALAAAYDDGGQVSTLIVPSDLAWSPAKGELTEKAPPEMNFSPATRTLDDAAQALQGTGRRVLFVGGRALQGKALERLGQIAEATGAELIAETFTARAERGAGRVPFAKLAYFAEMALDQLKGCKEIVTVGTKAPVSFFAYPNVPSNLVPDGCNLVELAGPTHDVDAATGGLIEALGLGEGDASAVAQRVVPDLPEGPLTADKCWQAIAALAPEGMILSEEAATSSVGLDVHMAEANAFDHMQTMGGSIGQALPAALGAAVAAPDRKVLCATGDGGAMYTIQSLWTIARENLDVVTVIFANRSYAILNIELMRVGAQNPGPKALDMLDIGRPDLNFTEIAQGMGVEAGRAETAEQFNKLLEGALARKGPFLIEAVL